jgi:hypothetical protein
LFKVSLLYTYYCCRCNKFKISTIYICGEILLKLSIWWNLSAYDGVRNNWMVCSRTNMMVTQNLKGWNKQLKDFRSKFGYNYV